MTFDAHCQSLRFEMWNLIYIYIYIYTFSKKFSICFSVCLISKRI
jgi:hypothetical protein